MSKIVTTTVSDEFYYLAKNNKIKWSEALRRGISLMLADVGGFYDNPLNKERKKTILRMQVEKAIKDLAELEEESQETKNANN